jgi:ATP synthase protein I
MDRLVRAQPINYLIKLQVVVLVLTIIFVLCFHSLSTAYAYSYGGVIAVFNSVLQRWHLYAAAKFAKADASKNLGRAYRCVAERWVLTIVMFAIGFILFTEDKTMLVGFIAMQAVVLFGNYYRA